MPWSELDFYDECRAEAEEEYYMELAEEANRYYNPDIDNE